jgi:hypothetical protein
MASVTDGIWLCELLFVEPVHAPKGQPGIDQAPVPSLDLDGIDVDDQGKKGNDVPLWTLAIFEEGMG